MAIEHADIIWLAIVTILGAYQLATFANSIGKYRQKYKVEPPSIDGPDEFVRAFRAQQNSLEFFPMFLSALWVAGLFCHQVPAALAGFVYIYSRDQYFKGYCRNAKDRVPPFKRNAQMLKVLLALSITGIVHHVLLLYTSINLKTMALGFLGMSP